MRLILLGSPGAGKGTQAKQIATHFQIPAISTGDIFRQAIQNETELGKKVKVIVESGQLVPDDIVIQLVLERLQQSDCKNGFLLDGFPRTLAQAIALQTQAAIDHVVDINVPDDEIVARLSGRRVHPSSGRTYHVIYQPPKQPDRDDVTGEPLVQRPDDTEETIRKRLAVYHSQTEPLQHFYQSQQPTVKYITVDGTHSVEQIRDYLLAALA